MSLLRGNSKEIIRAWAEGYEGRGFNWSGSLEFSDGVLTSFNIPIAGIVHGVPRILPLPYETFPKKIQNHISLVKEILNDIRNDCAAEDGCKRDILRL